MNLILNFKVERVIQKTENSYQCSGAIGGPVKKDFTGHILVSYLAVSSLDEELISVKTLRFNGDAQPRKGDLIYAEIADKENSRYNEFAKDDDDFVDDIKSFGLFMKYRSLTENEREEFFNSIYDNFDNTKLAKRKEFENLTDFEQAEFEKYVNKKNEEYRNSEEGKKELENSVREACKALKTEETAVEIGVYDASIEDRFGESHHDEEAFKGMVLNDNKLYSIGVVSDYEEAAGLTSIIYQSADK